MRHETRAIAGAAHITSTLLLLTSSLLLLSSAAAADALVADPYRAVDVTWMKHPVKGADYWIMLTPQFLRLKGLENEAFIQGAGIEQMSMNNTHKSASPWGYATPEDTYRVDGLRDEESFKDRLARVPFTVWSGLEEGTVRSLKVKPENFDTTAYDQIFKKYPETFLGPYWNEWDAGILHRLHRYTSSGYLRFAEIAKLPCNRAEMRENFHKCWQQAQVRLGPRMFGLSGSTSFQHYGCEWGGRISCVEITGAPDRSLRPILLFARSAARQFDVPFYHYTAYFRDQYHPNSQPDHYGAEAGMEVSLAWRQHLLSYYMGVNFQDFESQPYGQVRKLADGSHVLTPNGLEIKRLYEWTHSPKGVRGECYTPILFLLDRNHGYDQLNTTGLFDGFGPYKGAFLPSDADYYTDWAMKAINPIYNCLRGETCPDKSACIRNSPLGDVFDVFIANSDVKGKELRDDQLAKYSVVMALSDILWSNQLVNRIRKYVYEGGTFVMTGSQTVPFKEDVDAASCRVAKDETSVVTPFGRGRFITVTNPFMHKDKEPWKVPQQMKDLLQALHDEVVPFKITGACSFLYNWVPEGAREDTSTTDRSARVSRAGYWKAIIMNNAGTCKKGNEPNTPPDPKWTRTVTLELPENAEVEEVLEGLKPRVAEKKVGGESRWTKEKLVSFDVLSGQVIVVNVRGIEQKNSTVHLLSQPTLSSPLQPSAFPDQVYKPHPIYDKYLCNPEEHRYTKTAPDVIFDWKNPTGGAQPVTTNVFVSARYYIPTCTIETEAKANLSDASKPKGVYQGALFYVGNMIAVAIDRQNNWYLEALYGATTYRFNGPKATGEWEKIKVVFDRGEARFYVNGREYTDPKRGRMTFPQKECRDSFYERLEVDVGEMVHGWNNYFPGIVKSLKVTSGAQE